jgi:curved DNA-binding protein
MDYYDILGVSKSASDKELKSAYKKKSMEHHPDRTGGSDEKFKEINEAYATLKDPQKRAGYDQFGTAGPQQQRPQGYQDFHFTSNGFQGGIDINDLMRQFSMGGNPFGQRQAPMKNQDITVIVSLGLDEVYKGKTIRLSYELQKGGVQTHEITIPPGIHDVIKYRGLGNNGIDGVPRGDLYAKIKVNDSNNWKRSGLDLHTVVPINVFDLILGTEVNVTTPEGKNLSVKVPKGSQPTVIFSIHGYGIPDMRTGARGIIFVRLKTSVPQINNQDVLDRITTIKKDLTNN